VVVIPECSEWLLVSVLVDLFLEERAGLLEPAREPGLRVAVVLLDGVTAVKVNDRPDLRSIGFGPVNGLIDRQ
jgi:hypothetical protein